VNETAVQPNTRRAALSDETWQLPAHEINQYYGKLRDYCIIIPVINEGNRIQSQLRQMQQEKITDLADIIIADGGSSDGSLAPDFLRSQGVRALLVKTGSGKLGAQLRMAYAYALRQGYLGIVTVDGNNKDGTDAIPAFIEALKSGIDFVQGSRFVEGGKAINTPLSRWVAIQLIHAPIISAAARFRWTDTTNGFRAYSRCLLLDERIQPFRNIFSTYELLFYLSVRCPKYFACRELPVERRYPESGKTPTKISPIVGNLKVLVTLFKSVLGFYNP
jgi:dolichol-phosphate mannosyltransferase